MNKSKLFEVFPKLSQDETGKFKDFLRSPLFNKSKRIADLFDIYAKFYPDFNDKKMTKEYIFGKLYPGKKFNDSVLRNLNSDLLELTKTFLSLNNFMRDPVEKKQYLLKELNRKNIHGLFLKSFNETLALLEGSINRDSWYFRNKFLLYFEKDLYNSFMKKFSGDDMKKAESYFIKFFLNRVTSVYSYIFNQSNIYGFKYDLKIKDSMLRALIKDSAENENVLDINFNRYLLHSTGEIKYYHRLKELAINFGHMLDRDDFYDVHICLSNYIKRTRGPENKETTKEIFELRKNIIEKGTLIGENYISHTLYINLVKEGLKLGETKWVHNFIMGYKEKVFEKYRTSSFNYCMAIYLYNTKKLNEALGYLMKVKNSTTYFTLETKNLESKIYWELDEYEMLAGSIISYKQYVAKNRMITKEDSAKHILYADTLYKLYNVKMKNEYHKIKKIKEQISGKKILNKEWLLSEIPKLEKN